jgi:hypothetical protein
MGDSSRDILHELSDGRVTTVQFVRDCLGSARERPRFAGTRLERSVDPPRELAPPLFIELRTVPANDVQALPEATAHASPFGEQYLDARPGERSVEVAREAVRIRRIDLQHGQ